jgi:hypothetical protein
MTKELQKLLSRPTTSVPEAGMILGILCKNTAYAAAVKGDIPTIKIGRQKRVPTSWLRKQLGLDSTTAAKANAAR